MGGESGKKEKKKADVRHHLSAVHHLQLTHEEGKIKGDLFVVHHNITNRGTPAQEARAGGGGAEATFCRVNRQAKLRYPCVW